MALSFIAFEANHFEILRFLFIFSACVLGFLLLNFPAGKIFLGDAGAYLMGHLLVWSAIILVNQSSSQSFCYTSCIFRQWRIRVLRFGVAGNKKREQISLIGYTSISLLCGFLKLLFWSNPKTVSKLVATIILVPYYLPQMMGVLFWNNFSLRMAHNHRRHSLL